MKKPAPSQRRAPAAKKAAAPAASKAPAPPRISATAVANVAIDAAAASRADHPFALTAPPPGVLPRNRKPTMAQDDALTDLYSWAITSGMLGEGLMFPGYQFLAQLTQRSEYRRPAETIAKEMTRKWIRFTAKSDEDDKSERIKQLEDAVKQFKLRDHLRKALEVDGFFGRAQIFVDMTGQGLKAGPELATPLVLNKRKVPLGGLRGFKVVEPLWTYPHRYDTTDPLSDDFYRPSSWFVMGTQVHASRLLTVIGRPVPDLLKPAYMFGGLSLSQMCKPYVDNWLKTRQSVAAIISSFTTWVLSTDLSNILQGGDGQDVVTRAQLFTQYRDNRGLLLVDKSSEAFENISAPLGGLDALQSQTQEHMSACTGIPLSVLLGITPHGLNASNEGEMRTFFDWVEAQQEGVASPILDRLLKIIHLHLWGEIDEGIVFKWEPLWTMTAKEAAEIDKTKAEADSLRIADGVIDATEARTRVAHDEDSPYAGLDLDKVIEPPGDDGMGGMGDLLGGEGGGTPPPGAEPGVPGQQQPGAAPRVPGEPPKTPPAEKIPGAQK